MEMEMELTLAEIVQKYPSAASLFEKYDLDYCCHGKRSLEQACEGDLTKYQRVEHALQDVIDHEMAKANFVHYENMGAEELIDHIVVKHHWYLKNSMPVIHAHLKKVSTKHGDRHPQLKQIFELFDELKREMENHMFKEEEILFPRIKDLSEVFHTRNIYQIAGSNRLPGKLNVSSPINMMETEHEKAGSILHLIRELTDNYVPPADACTTYRLTFSELKEFEQDLHQHVHLENNILFPEAMKLEENILQLWSN